MLGLAGLVVSAQEAEAASIDIVRHANLEDFGLDGFELGKKLWFPKFDKNFGYLEKITIMARVTLTNYNNWGHDGGPNDWFGMEYRVTATAGVVSPLGAYSEFDKDEWFFPDANNVGPGGGFVVSAVATATGNQMSSHPAARLFFTGPGAFPVLVGGKGEIFLRPGGPTIFNREEHSLVAWVKVTYEFTPAPEPSTMALLGLVGVGALWRRRRKRQQA